MTNKNKVCVLTAKKTIAIGDQTSTKIRKKAILKALNVLNTVGVKNGSHEITIMRADASSARHGKVRWTLRDATATMSEAAMRAPIAKVLLTVVTLSFLLMGLWPRCAKLAASAGVATDL